MAISTLAICLLTSAAVWGLADGTGAASFRGTERTAIGRFFETAAQGNAQWEALTEAQKADVLDEIAEAASPSLVDGWKPRDPLETSSESSRGQRSKSMRFAALDSALGSPFTALYDASTGLSEPTAACKTNVNGFLSKCVFTGGSSGGSGGGGNPSTNGAGGPAALSKSCTQNLNTWLTKCVFASSGASGGGK
jgi:hypothetical protein